MKQLNRILYITIPVLLLFTGFAGAQEDIIIFETDDIVIEDVYVEEDTNTRTGQVTVFDQEDMEAMGARTVADVVERAPGVTVSRQGSVLEPQSVSIRGSSSRHVLVIIDGKSTGSLWTGGSDLSLIPVENIERIEIIRGAAAAIYGDGAVSGVINIITQSGSHDAAEAEVEYGFASFNTHQLNAKLGGPLSSEKGLSGELAAGGLYTGGGYDYEIYEQQVERLNNDGWAANASAGIDWVPDTAGLDADFSFSGDFYASERGSPGLMEFLTPEARLENIRGNVGLASALETESAGAFEINAGYAYKYNAYANPDEGIDDSNDNSSVSVSAGWNTDVELGGVIFGIAADTGYNFDYLYSTALTDSTGSSVDGEAVQHAAELHVRLKSTLDQFDFSPAAGLDWVFRNYKALGPDSDLAFSWSATTGWAPFRTDYEEGPLYVKLNSGTAYKNPSFQDLFWPSGSFAEGNPDLEPETSFNIDAGVSFSLDGSDDGNVSADFEIAGFFSKVENLIQWLPAAGGIWRPVNVGFVHNGGLELSSVVHITEVFEDYSLDISAVYNWLKCVDADPESVNFGNQLAYRPEHSGNISLLFFLPDKFTVELAGNYIDYRFRNNANKKWLDPVFLLSSAVNYDFNENFGIGISADNLLNKSYIDRLGYPVPGIEWSIKGRYRL